MTKNCLTEDRLSDSIYLLQPSRPVLVTTRNPDGSLNVAPFSWLMPVSQNPPLVGLALLSSAKKRQHTLVNIEREGVFVVNLPGLELAERLVRTSYRYPEGVNKFEQVDFQPEPSRCFDLPGIGQCRAHLECRAAEFHPTGDHTLVIGTVVAASYDPGLFDDNLMLQLDKTAPCVHLRQTRNQEGQAHFFLEPAGVRRVFVPYDVGSDPSVDVVGPESGAGEKTGKAGCEG